MVATASTHRARATTLPPEWIRGLVVDVDVDALAERGRCPTVVGPTVINVGLLAQSRHDRVSHRVGRLGHDCGRGRLHRSRV